MSASFRRLAAYRISLVGLVGALFTAALNAAPNVPRVEVFTDQGHPITRPDAYPQARIYRIDGLARAEAQLSEGLPADEQAALAQAKARLAAQPNLNDTMLEAGEGLARAYLRYGLNRFPAIVFDAQMVIYGVTDLAQAKRIYEAAR